MAKHSGGAKMTKVEKKVEKKTPDGVTHFGHSGGAKMENVEKNIEKIERKKKRSLKNLFGLLSVMIVAVIMALTLASCTSGEVKTYTTEELAAKYETNDPTDFAKTKMYIEGQFYEYKGDKFTLIPIDTDGDGYGVTFTCKDYDGKVKKLAKKADTQDLVTVLGTVVKVNNDGYVIDVDSLTLPE